MNRVMRKPCISICENKAADQLRYNCAADQRLCFCYIHVANTIPLLLKSEISSLYTSSVHVAVPAQFVSDLLENPEDSFCRVTVHMCVTRQQLATNLS